MAKTEDIDVFRLLKSFVSAAEKVRKTHLGWGPTDDGTKNGQDFDKALTELAAMTGLVKKHVVKTFEQNLLLLKEIAFASDIDQVAFDDGVEDEQVYDDGEWFTVGLAKKIQRAIAR